MSDSRRIYCVCSGCPERGCNASNGAPCSRNREWSGLSHMKSLGWRRRKGCRWLCPSCAEGARKCRRPPTHYYRSQNRVPPAADPVWLERGAALLDYLQQPRSWHELEHWATERDYTVQVLRNAIASVHERVAYAEGLWRATAPAPRFEPVPPGPASTLQARLAYEIL